MKYTREQRTAHRIRRGIHHRHAWAKDERHPLDGLSVREWVAEAREGWPKVPVPKDPYKAAQRVLSTWHDSGVTFEAR